MNRRVVLSNAVEKHLKHGGTIRYQPLLDGRKLVWRLMAVFEDEEIPVISIASGEYREFKSADAVIKYHLSFFPAEEAVRIPVKPEGKREAG